MQELIVLINWLSIFMIDNDRWVLFWPRWWDSHSPFDCIRIRIVYWWNVKTTITHQVRCRYDQKWVDQHNQLLLSRAAFDRYDRVSWLTWSTLEKMNRHSNDWLSWFCASNVQNRHDRQIICWRTNHLSQDKFLGPNKRVNDRGQWEWITHPRSELLLVNDCHLDLSAVKQFWSASYCNIIIQSTDWNSISC